MLLRPIVLRELDTKYELRIVRLLMGYHSNADNKFMDDYKTDISFEGKNGSKKEY